MVYKNIFLADVVLKKKTKQDKCFVVNSRVQNILVKEYLFIVCLFNLQAPDEKSLTDVALKLKENNIDHKLWIEQPENIPTCLVAKPYPKTEIQSYFKKLKLFKQ